jgi:hypothetical protein
MPTGAARDAPPDRCGAAGRLQPASIVARNASMRFVVVFGLGSVGEVPWPRVFGTLMDAFRAQFRVSLSSGLKGGFLL